MLGGFQHRFTKAFLCVWMVVIALRMPGERIPRNRASWKNDDISLERHKALGLETKEASLFYNHMILDKSVNVLGSQPLHLDLDMLVTLIQFLRF